MDLDGDEDDDDDDGDMFCIPPTLWVNTAIDITAALHRKRAHEEKTKDHYHGHTGKVLPERAKTAKNSPKNIAEATASQQPAERHDYLCSLPAPTHIMLS